MPSIATLNISLVIERISSLPTPPHHTQDMTDLDMVIPNLINNLVSIAVMLIGNMLTVVGVSPYFLIVMAVLMVLYSRLQAYYQRAALQVERFEATSRSPLYQV